MEHNTFFASLDAFINLERRRVFTASVQATYFAILREFYRQGFPKEITMTVRELGDRAGLKSSETVHVAKNILKNNGLIDFQTVGKTARRTIFTLVCPNVCSNVCPNNLPNNLPNNEGGLGFISCTQNTELSAAAPLPLPPTPPIPIPDNNNIYQSSAAAVSSQQLIAADEKDILEVWKEIVGWELTDDGDKRALKTFDEVYGRKIIKVAIADFVTKKIRQFKRFKPWCLDEWLKGGEGNGQAVGGVCMDRRAGGSAGGIQATAMATSTGKPSGKGRFDDLPPEELM